MNGIALTNRWLLVLVLSCCFLPISYPKRLQERLLSLDEPDTILHNDSKYIAVIGDIQKYTVSDQNMPYYEGTLNWIANHSNQIGCVIHTGDVTDHNYIAEWERFHNGTEPFTNLMPFYTAIGNHDYVYITKNWIWNQRDSTKFNEYVGFPTTLSHIVAYYDPSKLENVLVEEMLFEEDTIYLLLLESEPRKSVVHWADSLVKTMPDKDFILVIHSFVNGRGCRYDLLQYMTDEESSPAQYVWDSLVYYNDNLRCVICGHTTPLSQALYSQNVTGRMVPQIEFNIQTLPHGGDGYIQLWEFDDNHNVYVRTFNTHLETFVNDSITEFQFKFK